MAISGGGTSRPVTWNPEISAPGEHSEALEALSESSWPDVVGWLLAQRCDIDCEEAKAAKAQEKASGIRAPIVQAVDALPDAPVPPC